MASITSMMNSSYNTSSIYGTRNVLSGLASGMDTETMIENAVSGIKKKIQSLYQKRTKVEWQQEAFRSIIDKAVNLGTKYTSYSSKTNLLSSSFFNNAVLTTAKGTYANKVTASGKTSSDIKINAVKQLATAASYTVSGNSMFGGIFSSVTGKEFDINGTIPVSTVAGSLTFQYGGSNGTTFDISFAELENLSEVKVYNANGTEKTDATDTEKLMQAIKNKLSEISYTYKENGVQETVTADKAIKLELDADGDIVFSDGLGNGNTVKISSSSGSLKYLAGEDYIEGIKEGDSLTKPFYLNEYLEDLTLGMTYNGSSKTIDLNNVLNKIDPKSEKDGNTQFVEALQDEIDKAFGKGKIEVSHGGEGSGLSFKTKGEGDTLSLGGTAIKALGFESGDSNYVNTSKKLEDLLGEKFDWEKYRTEDKDGKPAYDLEINGAHISVTKDTTLESLLSSINSNANMGVKVSFSRLTNEFQFTATETGANSRVEFGGLAKGLFGAPEVSEKSSFSDVYGLNMESGSRNITFPDPTSIFEESSIEITDNMTKKDIVDAINKKYEELGLQGQYEAALDDKDQVIITDMSSGEKINAPISKTVTCSISGYGVEGSFDVTSDMTMEDVIKQLNNIFNNSHTASIDERTGQIVMTDRSGQVFDLKITNDSDGGQELNTSFNCTYTAGTDAIMDVTVNGKQFTDLTRSSNVFDIDGMSITVKGTFSASDVEDGKDYEPITFETATDTDKIIDAVRSFVNDYNELVTELKGAYSTQPAYKSGTTRYEPLTAEEEEGYTESQLAAYNEKAKQGILFGDTTLSSMYSRLLSAITPGGADGQTLREIGINTSYEDGLTTISLDENKLRDVLNSDPDKVKNAFTKTREGGASSDGLMQTLQNSLNTYVKTTGEPKGVLITKAGSVKAPTSLNNNSLNTQINNLDRQIQRWQDKMSAQIDRYTTQFTRLEQLVAQMNSQYSAMSGLMGGFEGY